MADLFDQIVYCKNCKRKMVAGTVVRDGFTIRCLYCPSCKQRVYHPSDFEEYKKFKKLKEKPFKVKLRIVGNSYTVSIPKEIIQFIREEEKIMNEAVNLCLEEAGKLALFFKQKFKNL